MYPKKRKVIFAGYGHLAALMLTERIKKELIDNVEIVHSDSDLNVTKEMIDALSKEHPDAIIITAQQKEKKEKTEDDYLEELKKCKEVFKFEKYEADVDCLDGLPPIGQKSPKYRFDGKAKRRKF